MAKSIMIQGTMSNAGKSFLTAGLCRVFMQDGYRVAPFKSQNMANNSYITKEGLEIGRAQAVQALACGIEPSAKMNPILLKPGSDTGTQVILGGKPYAKMSAMEYFKHKKSLIPEILRSFEELGQDHEIIVIEGAGSPAEINLNENDIVNMGLAKLVSSPVLLVGDIDRGGVFASLYGTVKLLGREERKYIKGLLINKFRGDIALLKPGLRMIEEILGIPVLGSIPMAKIELEDEDSLSLPEKKREAEGEIDIAVIRLPRISNFTDFDILARTKGVGLRYIEDMRLLGSPDLIIIPGTESSTGDLLWMRENGLERKIVEAASRGTVILGIGGGFQMLGRRIEEGRDAKDQRKVRGMGLLDAESFLEPQKGGKSFHGVLRWKEGKKFLIRGYELSAGRTRNSGRERELFDGASDEERSMGIASADADVFGIALHGIFENKEFARELLSFLCRKKGIESSFRIEDASVYREREFDKLASLLREHLDMEKIYEIMDKGMDPKG
ncbi:MAG: cobyric acid synthase [Johnsonella sp.]|nr:cobyric acid synthase [Johnsonella sp.]